MAWRRLIVPWPPVSQSVLVNASPSRLHAPVLL